MNVHHDVFQLFVIPANEGLGAVYILCDDVMQALSEVLVAHSGDEEYLVA